MPCRCTSPLTPQAASSGRTESSRARSLRLRCSRVQACWRRLYAAKTAAAAPARACPGSLQWSRKRAGRAVVRDPARPQGREPWGKPLGLALDRAAPGPGPGTRPAARLELRDGDAGGGGTPGVAAVAVFLSGDSSLWASGPAMHGLLSVSELLRGSWLSAPYGAAAKPTLG